jgi:hypothetical protein
VVKLALLALVAGCTAQPRSVTTVTGVQIVAIDADPPQPDTFDTLTLDTWVADPLGGGTDVLVWLCTPVDGVCIEGSPLGLAGMPFSFWTRVGRADPRSTTTNGWPLFAGLAPDGVELPSGLDGSGLLVWALACVPGFCPVMDQIAIDPKPGSEPWLEVAEGLADPSRWVAAAPEGYASLAVKRIPVWNPPDDEEDEDTTEGESAPNRAPELTEIAAGEVGSGLPLPQWFDLAITEDDGDVIETRSFATEGLIRDEFVGDEGAGVDVIRVAWAPRPDDGGRAPQLFLVVEDKRGGTDVWSSDKGPDPCAAEVEIHYTSPAYPGAPLVASVPIGTNPQATFNVSGAVVGAGTGRAIAVEMRVVETGELLAAAGPRTIAVDEDEGPCAAPFDRPLDRADDLSNGDLCAYGGALVDVTATVTDSTGVVGEQTIPAVLQIDPGLPCAQ